MDFSALGGCHQPIHPVPRRSSVRSASSSKEAQLMAEEKCNTMEEEVEMKTRKLRKLMARYQQSKNELSALRTELQDTIHEFQSEQADKFLSLRSLDQQLQLKNFLIDKFIPPEELKKVMRRVHWDEENETLILLVQNTVPLRSVPYSSPTWISIDGFPKQPLLRPNSAIGRSRPHCDNWSSPSPKVTTSDTCKLAPIPVFKV